jgi:hypothetical protein
MKTEWYGYLHVNGSVHVKRFFDIEDLQEVSASPFVKVWRGPWECESRDAALVKLREALSGSAQEAKGEQVLA